MGKQERSKTVGFSSLRSNIIPFLWNQGQRSIFYIFFIEEVDIGNHILRVEDVSISWLTVLVAYLYRQAEQATITLMPRMIQIVTGSDVNPILLRPVLGIVLNIDSVLLEMEQLMSWTQSGSSCSQFYFYSGGSYSISKTTQECASDTESVTLLS